MININSGTNSVIVTLNKNENDTSFYTWRLVNKDDNSETLFTCDDISTNPTYYNEFLITITSSIGLTAGRIDIPTAEYSYQIYKMDAGLDYLNIASASEVSEWGILRYIDGDQLFNRPAPTLSDFGPTASIKSFNVL